MKICIERPVSEPCFFIPLHSYNRVKEETPIQRSHKHSIAYSVATILHEPAMENGWRIIRFFNFTPSVLVTRKHFIQFFFGVAIHQATLQLRWLTTSMEAEVGMPNSRSKMQKAPHMLSFGKCG